MDSALVGIYSRMILILVVCTLGDVYFGWCLLWVMSTLEVSPVSDVFSR